MQSGVQQRAENNHDSKYAAGFLASNPQSGRNIGIDNAIGGHREEAQPQVHGRATWPIGVLSQIVESPGIQGLKYCRHLEP